ncbi:Nuclear factor NF-kappa-B p105 subunit [Mactra antiquata]
MQSEKKEVCILDTSPSDSLGILTLTFDDNKDNELSDGATEHKQYNKSDSVFTNIIAKPDHDGDNLLHAAIISKYSNIAYMLINLIRSYTVLSHYNNNFQTALHLATLTNDSRLVRRLVVGGAKVSLRDWRGDTALHIACRKGYLKVAQAILSPVRYQETEINLYEVPYQQIPQNLELRNADGLTCFLVAIINKCQDIGELLVESGTNVNAFEMKSGKTALHIAAENGDISVINYLVSLRHLDLNLKMFAGYTALQLARMRGRNYVEYVLLCAGAVDSRDFKVVSESDYESDSDDDNTIRLVNKS